MADGPTDIGKQQIAAVYAKALLGANERTGNTESVIDELGSLVDEVFDKLPQFEMTLSSERISVDEKIGILDRTLGSRVSPALLTFLKVLSRHGRLNCLRQIRREAVHQYNVLKNRLEVHVTSAHPMNDDLRQRVIRRLAEKLGQEVVLQVKVDSSLIGGLIVRVGDTVFDSSVRNKLNQMRQQAVQRVVEEIHDNGQRFADLSTSP